MLQAVKICFKRILKKTSVHIQHCFSCLSFVRSMKLTNACQFCVYSFVTGGSIRLIYSLFVFYKSHNAGEYKIAVLNATVETPINRCKSAYLKSSHFAMSERKSVIKNCALKSPWAKRDKYREALLSNPTFPAKLQIPFECELQHCFRRTQQSELICGSCFPYDGS